MKAMLAETKVWKYSREGFLTHAKLIFGDGSTLAQVLACDVTALSHYLNQVDLPSKVFHGIYLRAIS